MHSAMRKNLPNQLTIARLVLAGAFFVALNQYRYEPNGDPQTGVLAASIALFVVAALTDALDGYLARRWHVESLFGRVVDPVADKILIIGALMYLAGPRFVIPGREPHEVLSLNMVTGVYPWMVVLILLRELLVTSIRAALEGSGIKFAAVGAGKLKMILQSIVVPIVLLIVWLDPVEHEALGWIRDGLVYATVIVTVVSGLPYLTGAKRAVASGAA